MQLASREEFTRQGLDSSNTNATAEFVANWGTSSGKRIDGFPYELSERQARHLFGMRVGYAANVSTPP